MGLLTLPIIFTVFFGFEYRVELSTKPENCMGSDEDWEAATNALRGCPGGKGHRVQNQ